MKYSNRIIIDIAIKDLLPKISISSKQIDFTQYNVMVSINID